jgi:hypothetical protein
MKRREKPLSFIDSVMLQSGLSTFHHFMDESFEPLWKISRQVQRRNPEQSLKTATLLATFPSSPIEVLIAPMHDAVSFSNPFERKRCWKQSETKKSQHNVS